MFQEFTIFLVRTPPAPITQLSMVEIFSRIVAPAPIRLFLPILTYPDIWECGFRTQ